MELSTTHDKQFEEGLGNFRIISKKDNSQLNTLPKGLRKLFLNHDYIELFTVFENSNTDDILTYEEHIANFQNKYLRERYVLDCDEIKTRSLTGKKVTIKKDDFNHAFLSKNWGGLNFSQRYTILHWLQSTLSVHTNLPSINFISPYITQDEIGAYFDATNLIYLDFSTLNSGINIACTLIHEMDHFNSHLNPDIKNFIQVSKKEINLKNYLNTKNSKKAIDIDLSQVNKADWNSVLFLKNIISPIEATDTERCDVNSIKSFKRYMQNELYYLSPIEKKAYAEESRQLNTMIAKSVEGIDKKKLDNINKKSYNIQSLCYSPILKRLNESSRDLLLDKSMQTDYYIYSDLDMTTKFYNYDHKLNNMFNDIYDHFKNKNGKILER